MFCFIPRLYPAARSAAASVNFVVAGSIDVDPKKLNQSTRELHKRPDLARRSPIKRKRLSSELIIRRLRTAEQLLNQV